MDSWIKSNTLLFQDGDLAPIARQLAVEKIKASMHIGQPQVHIAILQEARGDYIRNLDFTPPGAFKEYRDIYDMYTKKKVDTFVWLNQKWLYVFQFIAQQGLNARLLARAFDGSIGNRLSLVVFIAPEDVMSHGKLRQLWNTFYAQRCLDLSLVPQWEKRIRACIELGQLHCVLMTLDASCFDWIEEPDEASDFVCWECRDIYTGEIVTYNEEKTCVRLSSRFKLWVGWLATSKWPWYCGFKKCEGQLSTECFLVVSLLEASILEV